MVPYLWVRVNHVELSQVPYHSASASYAESETGRSYSPLRGGRAGIDNRIVSNRPTAQNQWQRRIQRAEELGAQYSFATEILRFYVAVARFQARLSEELSRSRALSMPATSEANIFEEQLPTELVSRFRSFLSVIQKNGPEAVRGAADELRNAGDDANVRMLTAFWHGADHAEVSPGPQDFFARAFLQPYAVALRSQINLRSDGPAPYICPFCKRKPGLGILRPLGDGGQRSLVCSLCLAEWEFRRIVCPGCGEENHAKLPVYTAEELKHVRVEACDSCRTYIKTVDMTTNGLAEPVVDEMASIPLDLWAQGQGYAKLQPNLLQL